MWDNDVYQWATPGLPAQHPDSHHMSVVVVLSLHVVCMRISLWRPSGLAAVIFPEDRLASPHCLSLPLWQAVTHLTSCHACKLHFS